MNYHEQEARRIMLELDNLGSEFAADGVVRTILMRRISQEWRRATGEDEVIENPEITRVRDLPLMSQTEIAAEQDPD